MAPYETVQTSAPQTGRAVVLGGGLAGLLAARALADTFDEIVIIERHNRPLAEQVLPQVLSEAVQSQLDRLFPRLSSELVTDGAAIAVPPSEHRCHVVSPTSPACNRAAKSSSSAARPTKRRARSRWSRWPRSSTAVDVIDTKLLRQWTDE